MILLLLIPFLDLLRRSFRKKKRQEQKAGPLSCWLVGDATPPRRRRTRPPWPQKNKTERWKTGTGREKKESPGKRERNPRARERKYPGREKYISGKWETDTQSADKWEREKERVRASVRARGSWAVKTLTDSSTRSKFKPHSQPCACVYQQKQQQQLLRTHTTSQPNSAFRNNPFWA